MQRENCRASCNTAVDMKRGREKKTGRKRRWRFTLLIRRLGAVLSSVCSRGEHLNSALPPLRRTIQPYFFYSPPAPCPAFLETRQRKTRLESTGKLNSFVKTSRKGVERERERERRAQENACTNCGCRQKSGIRVDVETEGGSSRGKGEKGEGMKRARVQWGTGKGKLLQSERGGENT